MLHVVKLVKVRMLYTCPTDETKWIKIWTFMALYIAQRNCPGSASVPCVFAGMSPVESRQVVKIKKGLCKRKHSTPMHDK
jgi:hypothetical protein